MSKTPADYLSQLPDPRHTITSLEDFACKYPCLKPTNPEFWLAFLLFGGSCSAPHSSDIYELIVRTYFMYENKNNIDTRIQKLRHFINYAYRHANDYSLILTGKCKIKECVNSTYYSGVLPHELKHIMC